MSDRSNMRDIIIGDRQLVRKLVAEADELLTQRNVLQAEVDDLRAWKEQVECALIEFYGAVDAQDMERVRRYADMLRTWDEDRP